MARREDFDVWYDKFKPEENEDGSIKLYETYGKDLSYVTHIADNQHGRLWTIVDCDGKLYLTPGFRYVNRINYVVCKNNWNEKTRDYYYG